MKRLTLLVLSILILLNGCSLVGDIMDDTPLTFTEKASISSFDIYPRNEKFEVVGKFERAEYLNLTAKQKSVYIAMDNAVYEMKDGYIPLGEAAESDIAVAYNALRNDRPEYFWLPLSYTLRAKGKHYEIKFAERNNGWLYTMAQRREAEEKIKTRLTEWLKEFDKHDSEYDRELKAHDLLTAAVSYNLSVPEDYRKAPSSWNIVGAFCETEVVCEGYSKGMQVLSFMLGLQCTVITGVSEEPHMWNLIKIDGDWYHLDLTANDGDDGVYRFFFNVTTEYILKSRTINPIYSAGAEAKIYNTFLPECRETEYNYHIVNSLYIAEKSQVQSTVVSHICAAVRDGRRSVEFAVSPDLGFISGEQDAAEFFNIKKCISTANAELPQKNRIKKYSYGGVNGALGFMISW